MFNFFKKPAFGLDISDYSIEMISLEGTIEKPRLSALGREILEPGIVEDGKIIQKEKLAAVLKKVTEAPKFGKIEKKKLIFALPESKSFIHVFEPPPDFKKEKTEELIRSEAVFNFPFPLADLYFDFKIINKEALLVAVPKDIVNDYLEVFQNVEIKPIALEIESMSISRSLIGESREIILIADIGARTTNFSLFDGNRLRLSISIDIAGNKLSQSLVEKSNISFQEAENLKKEIGLDPEKKEGKVFLILQKEIQEIIAEIKKIEDYYFFQNKPRKIIEKIILVGGSAVLPYLPEYLAENLEKPVFIGDPWKKINIDILKEKEYFEKTPELNPVLYAPAIGSALRGLMKEPEKAGINLLPK